jgi:hypothetical protein
MCAPCCERVGVRVGVKVGVMVRVRVGVRVRVRVGARRKGRGERQLTPNQSQDGRMRLRP